MKVMEGILFVKANVCLFVCLCMWRGLGWVGVGGVEVRCEVFLSLSI